MAPSSRDRISVDLRGLKAALIDRALAVGVSPSDWVRATLSKALEAVDPGSLSACRAGEARGDRVRLCLRMLSQDALATVSAARAAGLPIGSFLAGLVSRVPVVQQGFDRFAHVSALIRSCAELAILSRGINRLVNLLQDGSGREALEYRGMLDTLNGDGRRHLKLASEALADLRPTVQGRPIRRTRGEGDEHEHI
jgi:hypothetical protein